MSLQISDQSSRTQQLEAAIGAIIDTSKKIKALAEEVDEGSYWRFQEHTLIAHSHNVTVQLDHILTLSSETDRLHKDAQSARGKSQALLDSLQRIADAQAMPPPPPRPVIDPMVAILHDEKRALEEAVDELKVLNADSDQRYAVLAARLADSEENNRVLTNQLSQAKGELALLISSHSKSTPAAQTLRRSAAEAFDEEQPGPSKRRSTGESSPEEVMVTTPEPATTRSRRSSGSESSQNESPTSQKAQYSVRKSFFSIELPSPDECDVGQWRDFSNIYTNTWRSHTPERQAHLIGTVADVEGKGCIIAKAKRVGPVKGNQPAFTDQKLCGYSAKSARHICVYLTRLSAPYTNEDGFEVLYKAHYRSPSEN